MTIEKPNTKNFIRPVLKWGLTIGLMISPTALVVKHQQTNPAEPPQPTADQITLHEIKTETSDIKNTSHDQIFINHNKNSSKNSILKFSVSVQSYIRSSEGKEWIKKLEDSGQKVLFSLTSQAVVNGNSYGVNYNKPIEIKGEKYYVIAMSDTEQGFLNNQGEFDSSLLRRVLHNELTEGALNAEIHNKEGISKPTIVTTKEYQEFTWARDKAFEELRYKAHINLLDSLPTERMKNSTKNVWNNKTHPLYSKYNQQLSNVTTKEFGFYFNQAYTTIFNRGGYSDYRVASPEEIKEISIQINNELKSICRDNQIPEMEARFENGKWVFEQKLDLNKYPSQLRF